MLSLLGRGAFHLSAAHCNQAEMEQQTVRSWNIFTMKNVFYLCI